MISVILMGDFIGLYMQCIFTPMRYFLYLSYKGTLYHGWQIQKNAIGVQQVINDSLEMILRQPVVTIGSGRTDTGVHANEQVLHFDIDQDLEKEDFVYKLNSLLPKDIAAHKMCEVNSDGHARFSAIDREYIYRITKCKNPFLPDLAYYFRKELDINLMNSLGEFMLTCSDFQSFSRVKTDVNNFICDIRKVEWTTNKNEVYFRIRANRFLRGMVRAIVGTMIDVGTGNCSKQEFVEIVASKDRRKAGSAAPPHGLFLNSITYPPDIFI